MQVSRIQEIEALLLEPVGCLAEFPSAPFHEIAVRSFGRKGKASASASRSYWHLLNLIDEGPPLAGDEQRAAEALEAEAVAGANLYEDVTPALPELKATGIRLLLTTSLSQVAAQNFVRRFLLGPYLSGVYSREIAGGVKAAPLLAAIRGAALLPEHTIFLTDTLEGIRAARTAGVHPILMMNDPDEARRLATYNPAGGLVSFREIPDLIRLIAAQHASR